MRWLDTPLLTGGNRGESKKGKKTVTSSMRLSLVKCANLSVAKIHVFLNVTREMDTKGLCNHLYLRLVLHIFWRNQRKLVYESNNDASSVMKNVYF